VEYNLNGTTRMLPNTVTVQLNSDAYTEAHVSLSF